jgi:TonB-dependent receptor
MLAHVKRRRMQYGVSTAAVAIAMAGSAFAQGAPLPGGTQAGDAGADADATVEEVVVTGFRASLQSAINVKRNESGVVDVIKAEDIADFPDNNLAESLQRIPGVAITRSAGEGRNITVRGLGPGSTRVRINGIEALASTGGSDADGGANRNRQFDFNVFASELFNSLAVRKTASASTEEGSLGATVDLQTSRPFDFKGNTLVVSGQYGYNDLSEQYDPRFAILGSTQWADGKLGALISIAYSKRNVREEGYNTVRWGEGPSNGGWCSPVGVTPQSPANNATTGASAANCFAGDARLPNTPQFVQAYQNASNPGSWHPRIPRYARLDYEQERLGITGSLQWRPTSRTLVSLDYLYSQYDSFRQENYLEGISFSRGAASPEFGKQFMSVREFQTDDTGTLVYGVFDNTDIRIESRQDEITTYFSQYTLTASQEITDNIKVSALLGTSKSNFKNPIQTTITFDRANQDGWTYDARGDKHLPNIGWGFDVNDPNAYTFTNANATGTVRPSEIRLRPQYVVNTFDVAQGDVEWGINDTFTVKAGAQWKRYVNDGREYRRATEFAIPAMPAGVTMANISTPLTDFGKGLDGDGVPSGWVVPNFDVIAGTYGIYSGAGTFELQGITNTNARGSWRNIQEASNAYYVQVNFETDILPWTLRGDFGVRHVMTDVSATGYQFAGGAPVPVTVKNDYANTLPAANIVAEVTDDILVRVGAAKVMVRPGLGGLNPGGTLNTTGNLTLTAGNPYLKPSRANTYDLSFEWYPEANALYSLGFFYKDFQTGSTTVRLTGPFSSFGFPESLLAGTGRTANDETFFSTTVNTEGGKPLKGFEVNIQQPFTFLERFGAPEWTSGFGVLFNYTYVVGEAQFCTQTVAGNCTRFVTNDPTGVSKNAYNATLYYENDKLSARVSAAYRDKYLFNVPSANAGNLSSNNRREYQDADWVPATTTIDTSISYNLTEKLKISFEGLNLTDEENIQYNDTDAARVWTYHHYGRQYYLGFRYAF